MLLRDGKTVDDGIVYVLPFHGLLHVWDNLVAGGVVNEQLAGIVHLSDDGCTLFGQLLFVRLGILVESRSLWLTVNKG